MAMIRAAKGRELTGRLLRRITTCILAAAFLCASTDVVYAGENRPSGASPNIVFILADDMGYGDPGCYNARSKAPTPNLDRLAGEGMRMTDAHAPAAVCVPTRYGLLTGRYPFRMPRGRLKIEEGRETIGSLLQRNGYHTACVGKWHLGFEFDDYSQPLRGGPVDRGFNYYFGIPASLDIPPYCYIENDRAVEPPTETIAANNSEGWTRIQGAFWREGKIAPSFKHEEVLPKLTRKAIEYIDGRTKSEQPFFLYLALPAPHTPWLPLEPFQGASEAGMYGDFVAQVDASIGRVLNALDEHKLTDETLVIFSSDNGPVWYDEDDERFDHRSAGPLRGMKGDAWEGGHRMPFLIRWPGKVEAGAVSDETICQTDVMATFAALLGVDTPASAGDSYNLLPVWLGESYEKPLREATISQSSAGVLAIRQGSWKLIPRLGSGGFTKPRFVEPGKGQPSGQLYHLAADLGESDNVYSQHPEVVERLTNLLDRYQQQESTAQPADAIGSSR